MDRTIHSRTVTFCACIGVALWAFASELAIAEGAGNVSYFGGTLSVTKPNGSVRSVSKKPGIDCDESCRDRFRGSEKLDINTGDILSTGKDSFAQINFIDGSGMTMRPNTRVKIESFSFVMDRPQEDNSLLRLLEGGVSIVNGLIGKRGALNEFRLETSAFTVHSHGACDVLDCSQSCKGVSRSAAKFTRGVYVSTSLRTCTLQNEAGAQIVEEGKFGFAQDRRTTPSLLSGDPGVASIFAELPHLNLRNPAKDVTRYMARKDYRFVKMFLQGCAVGVEDTDPKCEYPARYGWRFIVEPQGDAIVVDEAFTNAAKYSAEYNRILLKRLKAMEAK